MNWQIILGIIFIIGGIGNASSEFAVFLFGILAGCAFIYWGLKKKGLLARGKNTSEQKNNGSGNDSSRRNAPGKSPIPLKYIVFDIETTGLSRKDDRIIEIAAHKYINGKLAEQFQTYVNPGVHIPPAITRLTGIKDADVEGVPCIHNVKEEVLKFFGSETLVGHNIASFDLPFLRAQLGVKIQNPIIDTLQLSKKAFPGLPSYKLSALDQYLRLGSLERHRATNDILTTNSLFLACLEPKKYSHLLSDKEALQRIPIEQRTYPYHSIDIHSIVPTNPNKEPNTALTGKAIAFTGELSITREEAYQTAVDAGAVLKNHMSKKVDYLVAGEIDPRFVGEDGLSNKQRMAQDLIKNHDCNIRIIGEKEFLELASAERLAN